MTVTHPSVMTLRPVTEGRRPVRVTAPGISPARTRAEEAQRRARHATVTRESIHWTSLVIRVVLVAALVAVGYLAISQNWVASAAETFNGWYVAEVTPWMDMDPIPADLSLEMRVIPPLNASSSVAD